MNSNSATLIDRDGLIGHYSLSAAINDRRIFFQKTETLGYLYKKKDDYWYWYQESTNDHDFDYMEVGPFASMEIALEDFCLKAFDKPIEL